MTAWRNDVIFDYAQSLYVDHDLPTIFGAGIKCLNGLQ